MEHDTFKDTLAHHKAVSDQGGAIERVIDKRHSRGASDDSIIGYLHSLKRVRNDSGMLRFIDGLIAGVKASPNPKLHRKTDHVF